MKRVLTTIILATVLAGIPVFAAANSLTNHDAEMTALASSASPAPQFRRRRRYRRYVIVRRRHYRRRHYYVIRRRRRR